jgi:AcrR family transcriptional regulator
MISNKADRTFGIGDPALREPGSHETRETYDERLSHLLEAATRVIAHVGFEKASMRQVAKAAGTSLAGMYHYFDSKERMLFLIQFRTFSALLATVRERVHGLPDPLEQFHTMVRTHVNYFVSNMAALKVCSHELDSLGGETYEEILRIRREYYAFVRAIIDRVFEQHAPSSGLDRHVATMSLFGTLNWLYRWYEPKRGRAPGAIAAQIAGQFLHGIIGSPAGAPAEAPAEGHARTGNGHREAEPS